MKTKQLLKILIAAAWIDGEVQEPELVYLKKVATKENLLDDPEIQPLLSTNKPVSSSDYHIWLKDYLGSHPKLEDYQQLLESISGLVYADGDVKVEEAELLTSLQQLDPSLETTNSLADKFMKILSLFYRKIVYEKA